VLPLISTVLFAEPASTIAIGTTHQLFLDDYLLEATHHVTRKVMAARKADENPLLWPSEPWEPPMATVYGSIIRDDGQFKMWYKSGMGVAYAESADGLVWSKPRLDLVRIDDQPTNILFRKRSKTEGPDGFPFFYELFGVHRDERDPDPARRFKMGFLSIDWKYTGNDGDPWHKGQRRGLGVAASADGLHWQLIDLWATEAIVDGATHWLWDPARSSYVLYGRTRHALPEVVAAWSTHAWFKNWFSGRAVARVESRDFLHWNFARPNTAPVVLTADLEDPPGTEIYSVKVFPYENIFIGLVQVFHATPEESTLDVQLAVSRDGVRFTRLADRRPFLALGDAGSWDRFNLSLANNDPFRVRDELWFYYGGRMYRHGPYAGLDKGPEKSGIGVAMIPIDRFVALEASFEKNADIVTRPLRLAGRNLHLNVAAKFGAVTVELLDLEGKRLARSRTISADTLDTTVAWQDALTLPNETPVKLRILLENARLFSLWCAD
jgi:hypothetical protein